MENLEFSLNLLCETDPRSTKNQEASISKDQETAKQSAKEKGQSTTQKPSSNHRLNTQTLMNQRGTGEEREEGEGQVW